MRHRKAFRKFSRTSSHRKAMFANLAMALIENGRIKTTDAKAKELRRVAERLVTKGKKGTSAAKQQVYGELGAPGKHPRFNGGEETRHRAVVGKLFGDLAERFRERPGGYTRVVKIGSRKGDNAPLSIIEFVDYADVEGAVVAEADVEEVEASEEAEA